MPCQLRFFRFGPFTGGNITAIFQLFKDASPPGLAATTLVGERVKGGEAFGRTGAWNESMRNVFKYEREQSSSSLQTSNASSSYLSTVILLKNILYYFLYLEEFMILFERSLPSMLRPWERVILISMYVWSNSPTACYTIKKKSHTNYWNKKVIFLWQNSEKMFSQSKSAEFFSN